LKWDVPKASAGIALAGEDDLETVKNLHLELGESSFKIVVAKLADQNESTAVLEIQKKWACQAAMGRWGISSRAACVALMMMVPFGSLM
jgi:hypothetical protein